MTNLGERIRALATGQAAFFRLKMQLTDNSVRVFPPEEGGYYKVGESPHPIPVGSYLLCFYDSEHRSIVNSDQRFIVHPQADLLRAAQGLQGQLPLNFNLAGSPGGSWATHPASSPPAPPATVVVAPPSLAAPAGKPSEVAAGAEVDLEFRKHLHAMDLEERQQDFIRNSTYVKEVGELFMLNRLMRRDMMEMQRSMVMHAQHAFRDIEQVKTTIQGLLDLEIKVVSHVESRLSRPPVPPPDYVGLGNSAINLLKEVSVALIQRGQPERTNPPLAAPPQLPPAASSPFAVNARAVTFQAVERLQQRRQLCARAAERRRNLSRATPPFLPCWPIPQRQAVRPPAYRDRAHRHPVQPGAVVSCATSRWPTSPKPPPPASPRRHQRAGCAAPGGAAGGQAVGRPRQPPRRTEV